jgi:hypothetical protein
MKPPTVSRRPSARAERLPGLVGHDDRAALGRHPHPGDRIAPHGGVREDLPARIAEAAPIEIGVLLGPPRLG